MAMWRWLKDALVARPAAPEAKVELAPDEVFLRDLLSRLGDPGDDTRIPVGDREFWSAIERLIATGRGRTATDILSRFVAARPHDAALAMRLCELHCERLEHSAARPLLERLTTAPEHALRARLLLADAAERAGDDAEARRQLEHILAVDLDYPQARGRADRLGLAAPAVAATVPTLAGLPEGGADLGRWRLLRELGRGASGAVYLARDEELEREVAIKILHPQARHQALGRARAWLEARIAAAIRHPGVVAIYDLDEERQLLAMELCTGGSLSRRLRKGPLPPAEALTRALMLLSTLVAVHARGVVHGDVKPANLLFRDEAIDADLVLGDFGLAQLADENARSAGGTLAYMAPEVRRGVLTPAADVYAAGVILLELLSGSAALSGWLDDRTALLRGSARWSGELVPAVVATLGPARAEALRALALALVATDPAARPDASAAARRLAELLPAP